MTIRYETATRVITASQAYWGSRYYHVLVFLRRSLGRELGILARGVRLVAPPRAGLNFGNQRLRLFSQSDLLGYSVVFRLVELS